MVRLAIPNVALAGLTTILVSATLHAEQTGEIRGTVADPTRARLSGVLVTARSPRLPGQRTTLSDETGFFRMPLLPVGTYELTFERNGFERLTLSGQEVSLGHTATLPVAMRLAGLAEETTVTHESPLIDATRSDTSYRLNAEELRSLPTPDRTIAELVQFTPGVTGVRANTLTGSDTGLPSFRGEGDAGNNWLVDGLSTKGVAYNGPGVRVNYDAWDEIEVVSDPFAAELGQAMGGVVNVVTKSGGNAFHGEAGALVRPAGLRAERQTQLSAASLPETSIQNYFANLGGPIVKDKLWFFLSDNIFSTTDQTSDQTVGWLAIPAGERRVTTNNVFGKLSWTPRPNHTVSASGMLDESLHQTGGIGVPETYAKAGYEHSSLRVNYRGILSSSLSLTAAAGHYRMDNMTEASSGDYAPPSYFWQDVVQTTNNIPWASFGSEARTDLALGVSWLLNIPRTGRHELRAGVSHYRNGGSAASRCSGYEADPWPGNGFDDGVGVNWIAPGSPSSLTEYRNGESEDSTQGFGLYLQDTAVLGRASLMLGLRADTQGVFNDAGWKVWQWGLGDFLQPRLSLAVDLAGDGRTFLKLGYGQFAMPIAGAYLTWVNSSFLFTFRQHGWTGPAEPTDSELTDPANWTFLWEQSGSATPVAVDSGLQPNRVHRVLLGLERRLGEGWVVMLRGIRSRTRDLLEDVVVHDPASPAGLSGTFTNFEWKKRDYWGLEAELNARVGAKLTLDASYTWSQAKGATSGNAFESGTWSALWGGTYDGGPFGDHPDMPAGDPRKELYDSLFGGLGGPGIGDEGWFGYLPYSVDHDVKVLARYLAPFGIRVSAALEWLSGYHWEKKGFSPGYGGYLTFPEGRGGRTTPTHAYLDFTIGKELTLRKGLVLDLGVNVYNLFDSQAPVSYAKEDNELFGQVWGRQLPRWAQIRVGLKF